MFAIKRVKRFTKSYHSSRLFIHFCQGIQFFKSSLKKHGVKFYNTIEPNSISINL